MRRLLSILLALVFGIGPLTATLQASEDSQLPACCRRLGAHHCAMSEDGSASARQAGTSLAPSFSAPSRCPSCPSHSARNLSHPPALTLAQSHLHADAASTCELFYLRSAASAAVLAESVRGPPSSFRA